MSLNREKKKLTSEQAIELCALATGLNMSRNGGKTFTQDVIESLKIIKEYENKTKR